MIVQKDSFEEVVASNRMGKPVIAGGPYVTSSAEEIQGVDHLLKGEVEQTFAGFLEDFTSGRAKKRYPAPPAPDITNALTPRFDLLN